MPRADAGPNGLPLRIEHAEGRPRRVVRRRCLLLRAVTDGALPRAFLTPRIAIGSAPDADFVLDAPGVAPVHARVVRTQGGYCVLDPGTSDDGVRVDGVRVRVADLTPGQHLQVGSAQVRFDQDEEATPLPEPPAAAFERALSLAAATGAPLLLEGPEPWHAVREAHRLSPRRRGPLLALQGSTVHGATPFGRGLDDLLALATGGTLVVLGAEEVAREAATDLRQALETGTRDVGLIATRAGGPAPADHPLLAWLAPARLAVPRTPFPPEHGPLEPFKAAKDRWVEAFERRYLARCLQEAGGNVSRAARMAGLDRKYLRGLLKRHRLRDHSDSGAPADGAYPEGPMARKPE
ncbi:MAG: FHA domain-containing protein [Myxococcota bacterium]